MVHHIEHQPGPPQKTKENQIRMQGPVRQEEQRPQPLEVDTLWNSLIGYVPILKGPDPKTKTKELPFY